jgi:hypothetical protein
MPGRFRPKLSFANVVAVIALFVALGGSAYAVSVAPKNSVTSKSIKKGAIKSVDVKNNNLTGTDIKESTLTGVDRCPSGASNRTGDVCFGGLQGAANWDAAERDCVSKGLRLPSISEALLLMSSGAASGTTWADEVLDPTLRARVNKVEPKIEAVGPATAQNYYCVAQPTS